MWAIWWDRNKRIFHRTSSSIQAITIHLERSISELVNASHNKLKHNLVVTSWDSSILQEWKKIHVPFGWCFQKTSNKVHDRALVKWIPPSKGVSKINFDGSSRGNPGNSGASVCIRDHQGLLLAIKCCPLPFRTNNMAEAHALFQGLILAKNISPSPYRR